MDALAIIAKRLLASGAPAKTCSMCEEVKPDTKTFYNTNSSACKVCKKAKRQAAYDPEIQRIKNNAPSAKASRKRYSKTPEGKYANKISKVQSVERDPKKLRARQAVADALRTNRLIKKPCSKCNSEEDVQAHHSDYDSPLLVDWLCRSCHTDEHNA